MPISEKLRAELSKYAYIRFSLYDMNGTSRGHVVPGRNAPKYFEDGMDVYQGIVFYDSDSEVVTSDYARTYNHGNVVLTPDPSTLRPLPWCNKGQMVTGEVLCSPHWKQDLTPQLACPRTVAQHQLHRLEEQGLELMSGFEVEYCLFHVESMKAVFDRNSMMSNNVHNRFSELLSDFDLNLFQSGIDVDRFHCEFSPGMFEAVMKPAYGIEGPDAAINLKQGLREMADLKGLKATFISKYNESYTGVGTHFNFSVLSKKSNENVFFDACSPDNLSAVAKHWIAGILKHSRALTVLCSPTPNCYRRLHQIWAPGEISWGIEDREASLRVKNHGPSGTYMENRIPSGNSNPYLVMAATVAAGLDGVINKLECPAPGSMNDAGSKHLLLPKSLPEAMQALEEDKVIVDALGDEFVCWFIAMRNADLKKFECFSDDNKQWDFEKYLYL